MPDTNITEFVTLSREQLLRAIVETGAELKDLKEVAPAKHPYGRWNQPVVIFLGDRPVAAYHLAFPTRNGRKTCVFEVKTFPAVQTCLQKIQSQHLAPHPA